MMYNHRWSVQSEDQAPMYLKRNINFVLNPKFWAIFFKQPWPLFWSKLSWRSSVQHLFAFQWNLKDIKANSYFALAHACKLMTMEKSKSKLFWFCQLKRVCEYLNASTSIKFTVHKLTMPIHWHDIVFVYFGISFEPLCFGKWRREAGANRNTRTSIVRFILAKRQNENRMKRPCARLHCESHSFA